MEKNPSEIVDLRERICELQAMTLAAVAATKALKEMSTLIWEAQNVRLEGTDAIPQVLNQMQKEHLDILLSSFADSNMEAASVSKRDIDRFLKVKMKQLSPSDLLLEEPVTDSKIILSGNFGKGNVVIGQPRPERQR